MTEDPLMINVGAVFLPKININTNIDINTIIHRTSLLSFVC